MSCQVGDKFPLIETVVAPAALLLLLTDSRIKIKQLLSFKS